VGSISHSSLFSPTSICNQYNDIPLFSQQLLMTNKKNSTNFFSLSCVCFTDDCSICLISGLILIIIIHGWQTSVTFKVTFTRWILTLLVRLTLSTETELYVQLVRSLLQEIHCLITEYNDTFKCGWLFGVDRMFESVCLSVYLFVRSITQKWSQSVQTWCRSLGYHRNGMVLRFQGHRLGLGLRQHQCRMGLNSMSAF